MCPAQKILRVLATQVRGILRCVPRRRLRPPPATEPTPVGVPEGHRQGIITAITVLLGFSLTFFRFWGFEGPGQWTARSVVSTGAVVAAALLQLVALVRSLRLEDDNTTEYRKTVVWFIASA